MVRWRHFEAHVFDKAPYRVFRISFFPSCKHRTDTHRHTQTYTHTHTLKKGGVVTLVYILLLLNKFLMSCCGLTGTLHSIPHSHTRFRCGLAKCAFNPEFSNWTYGVTFTLATCAVGVRCSQGWSRRCRISWMWLFVSWCTCAFWLASSVPFDHRHLTVAPSM